jgi:hypothetical protein
MIMFIEILNVIGVIYLWTWFIWPFIFIKYLVNAIKNLVKEEQAGVNITVASIALLVIICGIQISLLSP